MYVCGKVYAMKKYVFIVLPLVFVWGYGCKQTGVPLKSAVDTELSVTGLPTSARQVALSKEGAIALAEAFVAAQGYTDVKPDLSKVKVQFEKDEYASSAEGVLQYRHNTLRPKAIGARQYEGKKWLVGFAYAWEEDNIARAVTMDSIGSKIFMQSQDVRMDWVQGLVD